MMGRTAITSVAPVRHPLLELTVARVKGMLREPEMVFWVFVFPILMALALGIAFRTRVEESVPVAVQDAPGAQELAGALRSAGGIRVVTVPDAATGTIALRDGAAHLVVVPGDVPTYRYDPTRSESRLARLLVDRALQIRHGWAMPAAGRDEEIVTPGSRYIDWLIPGLLGMNIMGTGMWGIGFSIVFARSRKLLKRLVATPMSKSHYLLSQILARVAFLGLEVLALLGFAWAVFSVRSSGPLWAVAMVSLVGALSFGGLGLLVASRPRTIEAVSGLMNVVMVPMWITSGVFFASSNFPEAMQPFIRVLPLTALIEALRAVMLNGDPLVALTWQLGVLSVWGAGSFIIALRIFRWQ
jgi:ABC transporter DrrB family efflux protein